MAITKVQKATYNDEIKPLKAQSDEIEKKIREITLKKKSNPKLEPYYNLEIIAYLFKTIDIYIRMSNLSVNILGIKNNKSLDLAKSNFSKILQLMKEIVGDDVDRDSLKENEEYLERINRLNPRQLYDLAIKIDDTLNNLKNSMGEESKWKWFFVELQAKVAVIARNLINFSDILKYRDPREEFFRTRIEHLRFAKDLLEEAAKQYRTKYELSSKSREDLKKSIDILEALRKIHITMGEANEAEKLKTIIDAARLNLEADDKKQNPEEKLKKKPK
ncbi:MAG TPA: hypothetical protein PKX79_06825 [Spirochaetota bacterium]|nr:hypothetical protein [Spirochaetota bacterium]HOK92566.1 hypothetical protein [Spirochaetota bacterium]HPP95075.1 hypothetical protein [Spirochaetota bacterium]